MGIIVSWDDDAQTTIYINCTGEWTEQEGLQAVDEIARLVASVDHPVYGINDFRGARASLSVNGLRFIRALRYRLPMHDSFVVMVGAQLFVSRIMDVANRVYKDVTGRVHFAASPEEARALIARHRQSLAEPL